MISFGFIRFLREVFYYVGDARKKKKQKRGRNVTKGESGGRASGRDHRIKSPPQEGGGCLYRTIMKLVSLTSWAKTPAPFVVVTRMSALEVGWFGTLQE